jgi:two-component system response regulator PilR (NtrC family)
MDHSITRIDVLDLLRFLAIKKRMKQRAPSPTFFFLVRTSIILLALAAAFFQATRVVDACEGQLAFSLRFFGTLFFLVILVERAIHFRFTSKLISIIDISLDPSIVTGVVYITGGPISPFLFLYIPLTMLWAFLGSLRTQFFIISLSGILYLSLIIGMQFSFISPTSYFDPSETSLGFLILQGFGLTGAMVTVGLGTNILRSSIERREQLVADSARSIRSMGEEHRTILDSVPDAVITVDGDGIITCANAPAHAIFDCTTDMVGQSFLKIACNILPTFSPQSTIDLNKGKTREFAVTRGPKRGRWLESFQQAIGSTSESSPGVFYYFRDITSQKESERRREIETQYVQATERRDSTKFLVKGTSGLVGESKLFLKVIDLAERVSKSDATVLLCGESGTGKELIARAIHQGSRWSEGPFVAVNCGAIPESLIESQLFGHKRGAFTGAVSDHTGFFREAMNGTLFLDEIGELPLHVQATLLRALQERTVRPVGGTSDIPINSRIIAATNKNLRREAESGTFREDLYYRINVVNITIPPLRERREDLPMLISHFVHRRTESGRAPPEITSDALRLLVSYHYPGNIRELENILERAIVLGGSLILPDHLPEHLQTFEKGYSSSTTENHVVDLPCSLDSILASIEREYLNAALAKANGSRKVASQLLGVNMRSLRYRIQKYELESSD